MKRFLILVLLITGLMPVFAGGSDIGFEVEVPARVLPGSRFRVNYILSNARGYDFKLSGIKNAEVVYNYSDYVVKSGIFSSIYTIILQAGNEGTIKIPSATVYADGKVWKSASKKVKIKTNRKDNPSVKVALTVPDNVEPGEVFKIVYVQYNGYEADIELPEIKNAEIISKYQPYHTRQLVKDKNGVQKVEEVWSYVYVLKAGDKGRIKISATSLKTGNKKYKVKGTEINVEPDMQKIRKRMPFYEV
ncbi:BatD family protein [Coprobacter tertius]|uniref:BatD family protein n=1 Tax=Coprobacter tertius TaxID=2944915 RepID=A0ABT1MGW8_9BACT|nr:BatD family protein [Coprobacter tertius]MCP9611878.1 BatD family protein [Coprobacter tertius]